METVSSRVIAIGRGRRFLCRQILVGGLGCFLFTSVLKAQPHTGTAMSIRAPEATAPSPVPTAPPPPCDDWDELVPPGFESKVSITSGGYWKVVTSNGIPKHEIGIFPMTGCGRPTAISEQNYTFVMPAYSSEGILWGDSRQLFTLPTPPFQGRPEVAFGVAVNGVPIDPAAGEWWAPPNNRVQYETPWTINPLRYDGMQYDLDLNNGHVQPEGAYHYHGFPYGLFNEIRDEQQNAVLETGEVDAGIRGRYKIVLLGWAFDGNPIYGEECGENNASLVNAKSSWKVRTSTSSPAARTSTSVPSTDDYPLADFLEDYFYDETLFESNRTVRLDECNGHRGPTPEFPRGIYHYHILEKTDSAADIGFPYIGRCYRLFTYRTGPNIFPKETNPRR